MEKESAAFHSLSVTVSTVVCSNSTAPFRLCRVPYYGDGLLILSPACESVRDGGLHGRRMVALRFLYQGSMWK
jgi:hypothetical protein